MARPINPAQSTLEEGCGLIDECVATFADVKVRHLTCSCRRQAWGGGAGVDQGSAGATWSSCVKAGSLRYLALLACALVAACLHL